MPSPPDAFSPALELEPAALAPALPPVLPLPPLPELFVPPAPPLASRVDVTWSLHPPAIERASNETPKAR
jgi:hypothetical protein